jgi:hypothetical protein
VTSVHSSTSSSNDRIPAGSWPRSWLLTLTIVGVLLGGWELLLRTKGVTPSVEADREAWILARGRIGSRTTVITGSSRIQAVLDPTIWVAEVGGAPPEDLALPGGNPIPVLEDLAADTGFRGLVLTEILPMYMFDQRGTAAASAREHVRAYHDAKSSPAARWEAWLRVHVASRFAFRRPDALPQRSYATIAKGELPPKPFTGMTPERYHFLFFRRLGLPANRPDIMDTLAFRPNMLNTRPAKGATLDSLYQSIQRSVAAIHGRGGQVVFIKFPACGGRRLLEEKFFPSAVYWTPLKAITGAPMIDLGEFPEVTSLDCFDGSHIDVSDAPGVARIIARRVRELVPLPGTP